MCVLRYCNSTQLILVFIYYFISHLIYMYSSRFLKQEQAVGSWFEVDEEVAREKASQCLRDIVAAVTKMKSVNSMVDCSGNINMSMMSKSSKSTTSLRNASSFASVKMRNSSGHGTSNATFPSFTNSNPALVSSSSTSTLVDRMNHTSGSSNNINVQGGLRGSVASFFDQHRNNNNSKNDSASNVLAGITSASRTAAQSGLALLRATPVSTNSSTGTKGGFGVNSRTLSSSSSGVTPTVSNQRQMPASTSTQSSALGNFEWNRKISSNAVGESSINQQNNDSTQRMSSMSSVRRLQQERQSVPAFGEASSIGSTATGSQSAAARAGLALLQRGSGMGTNHIPSSLSNFNKNANMSRVVSNMHSSHSSMASMSQQQQPSQNLPTRNSFHTGDNIGSTNTAMQISSNNLRDMNQPQQQQQTMSNVGNNMNYSQISTHLSTQQQQRSNSKRNLISVSAPNLGDISLFLAKRRRPMTNAQWANNEESMISSHNDSFTDHSTDETGNRLEPNQINDSQQHSTNVSSIGQMQPPRAASMMSLGANTPPVGGAAIFNTSGTGQNNHAANDHLLKRFHELRSHMMTTTASIENIAQNSEKVRRLSCVREQQESSMPSVNFHWNNNTAGNSSSMLDHSAPTGEHSVTSATSRSNNMFASLLQQPRIVNAVVAPPSASSSNQQPVQQPQSLVNNHNNNNLSNTSTMNTTPAVNDIDNFDCFTGLGEAMGDSDDTALQRWIDHMAEEELS